MDPVAAPPPGGRMGNTTEGAPVAASDRLDHKRIAEILDRIDFFDGFTPVEKVRIAGFHTHFSVYPPDAVIITEGDAADHSFFILLAGTVSVTKGPDQVRITRLAPGDVFGEATFLTGHRRTTNVVADELVIVIRVDRELMGQLSSTVREKIKDRIIEMLVKRLDAMNAALLAAVPLETTRS